MINADKHNIILSSTGTPVTTEYNTKGTCLLLEYMCPRP